MGALVYVIAHMGCGVVAVGMLFAYFQRNWKEIRKEWFTIDQKNSLFVGLVGGPISLLVCLTDSDIRKAGWLWPFSIRAELEAGKWFVDLTGYTKTQKSCTQAHDV